MKLFVAAALLCLTVTQLDAAPRSRALLREFQRLNPCPSTGERRGACPGWQIDHQQPLCAGGPDAIANLQWLTLSDHAAKTRKDVAACFHRAYRSGGEVDH